MITCVEGLEREDEHERRRDDIRSKTISSRRKEERHPDTERRKDVKASPVTSVTNWNDDMRCCLMVAFLFGCGFLMVQISCLEPLENYAKHLSIDTESIWLLVIAAATAVVGFVAYGPSYSPLIAIFTGSIPLIIAVEYPGLAVPFQRTNITVLFLMLTIEYFYNGTHYA